MTSSYLDRPLRSEAEARATLLADAQTALDEHEDRIKRRLARVNGFLTVGDIERRDALRDEVMSLGGPVTWDE